MAQLRYGDKRLYYPGFGLLNYTYVEPPTGVTFPTSGLTSYWEFEEASGTVYDLTSNDNDLTTNLNVTYSQTGKINDCVSLTNYAYLRGTSDTVGGSIFSMSAWVKINTFGTHNTIYATSTEVGNIGCEINVDDGSLTIVTHNGSSGTHTKGAVNITTGSWYHVVVVFGSKSDITFYVNNNSEDIDAQYDNDSNIGGTFGVGGGGNFNTFALDGLIDNMGVWDRKLTAGEVGVLWNNGDGLAYPI